MNHKFKKLLAVLFSFSLVFCLMSAHAWATGGADPVARIGETPYNSLQAAFDEANQDSTITLLRDVTLNYDETVTAPAKPINLNMGGKSIQSIQNTLGTDEEYAYNLVVPENGTLTIIGTGTFEEGSVFSYGTTIIGNTDSITVNPTFNGGVCALKGGSVIVNNGTFNNGCGVFQRDFLDKWNPVKGGTFTINGGTFTGTKAKATGVYAHTGELIIKGGIFADGPDVWTNKGAVCTISGGLFSNEPDNAFLAAELNEKAFYFTQIEEEGDEYKGYWKVSDPAARIGQAEYGTFQAAFQAAQANDTITLLDDVVVQENLTLDKSVTVDGDTGQKDESGYQITRSFLVLDGTLSIKQGAFNSSGIATMGNDAKVIVSGGTFSDGVGVHQRNWNTPITGGAVTITGGTFNDTVYAHTGVLTIEGGTFTAPVKAKIQGAVTSAVVNITGGYFDNDVLVEKGNPTISIKGGFFKLQWIPDHAEWLSHIAADYAWVDSLEHEGYVLAVVPKSERKTVTYQGNGGKNTEENKDSDEQMFHPAHKFELWKNNDAPGFEREGYAFSGWNTKPDGTGTNYAAGEVVKLAASTTLYAQWKATGETSSSDPDTPTTPAKPTAPSAPEITEVTDKSIIVNAAAGLEYSIDGGKIWKCAESGKTTVTFDGLTPETKYSVIARVAKTDKAEVSDASVAAEVTTKKTEEEKPGTDTPTPAPTPDNPTYDALTSAQKKISDAVVKSLGVDAETAAQMVLEAEKLGVKKDTLQLSTKTIMAQKDGSDPKGTDFGTLNARAAKRTNSALTLSWKKQKNADGYMIFGNKCGKGSKMKLLKTIKKNNTVTWTQKKLKKGTYYKYMIVAYKNVNDAKMTTSASVVVYTNTKGGKITVAKSVKVNKTSVNLKKGKSTTIKVSEVLEEKKLKLKTYRPVKYESSDTKVATVSAKGKIIGKKKGSAKVLVYTQNGLYKTVKVTVK